MRLVPRTFSRIPEGGKGEPVRVRRLDEFRNERAYVLLGAPGSGKSTEFRREAECSNARFVTARNFICLDRQERATSTLFIDGLDEMRVSSGDRRKPLDQIRARLSRLGCRRFRISCRDGEWLGANDLRALKALTGGDDVPILRLDPLQTNDIREILKDRFGGDESQRILDGAIERGLQGLLENPLTLRLVAEALPGSSWPQNKTDAFTLACKRLLTEVNDEHLVAVSGAIGASALLGTAGKLCAFQLLTGRTGFCRFGGPADQGVLDPGELGEADPSVLNRALGSRIFESPDAHGGWAPIHRLVAEFLAAQYLAQLVRKGLPVRRVLSLVCGFDGRVVSEFSGLTAWLAALCKTSRFLIIERNPLGVLMQGDVKEFSPDEKSDLIECVATQPWQRDDYYRLIVSGNTQLEDLATPDMGSVFRTFLRDPVNDDAGLRAALLVLRSLQGRFAVRGLSSDLLRIARTSQWHPQVRFHALKALCIQSGGNDKAATDLTVLLEAVAHGDVHDEDDELLGLLLDSLYPSSLDATDIVRFLRPPKTAGLYGTYRSFWAGLPSRGMPTRQIGEMLDALYVEMPRVNARFGGREIDLSFVRRLPGALLARYLRATRTDPDCLQLYDWLELSFNFGSSIHPKREKIIQDWLCGHPNAFRTMIECGVARYTETTQTTQFEQRFCRILDSLDCPEQLVGWLRQQSLIAPSPRVGKAFRQLSERGAASADRSDTDSGQGIEPEDQDIEPAKPVADLGLERSAGSVPPPPETSEESDVEPWQEEWRAEVRANLEPVRSGQCSPSLLNGLARAYFGEWSSLDGETPPERLRSLLGDESLVNAALGGLRSALFRTDAPTPDEVADLVKKQSIHPLARPYLAGMAEIEHAQERPAQLLSRRQLRIALAFHFGTPFVAPEPYRADGSDSADRDTPPWYRQLLESEPQMVAEVMVKMARAEIFNGLALFHVLHKLETSTDHERVARLACLPLLRSIPLRANSTQMDGLACLLRSALRHCDRDRLLGLIDKKLGRSSMLAGQRVYWLTAGLLSSSAEKYREALVESLATRETLVQSVVAVAVGRATLSVRKPPLDKLDPESLECLIRFVGKLYSPLDIGTLWIEGPVFVEALIKHLSESQSQQASDSLARLSKLASLESWQPRLQQGLLQQAEIRRAAEFRYVSTCQLRRTLGNGQPASAADLAALTTDHLETIARRVRDGNTSDWRQFWDFAKGKAPAKPRHEELCRDALLSDLRSALEPLGVDAQPEGRYADDKRADIRVAYDRFNVPVEIKKSTHRELWTAIQDQLVRKYTRGPGCDGYGVYVVLWFGLDGVVPSPSGIRPRSAKELKNALEQSLSTSERLKLSIVVVDVAVPRS